MSLQSFLYRRLCRYVTCELILPTGGTISLRSKFDIASLADAVVHPFYWQLFHLLVLPPRSVVDVGGHCGHFTVLADVTAKARFGKSADRYTIIEPNPFLAPILVHNIAAVGLSARTSTVHGLVGFNDDNATLWVRPKNYLATSFEQVPGAKPFKVPCVRVTDVIPSGPIDVLKIDIEGGEYALIRNEPALFERAKLLFIEIHDTPGSNRDLFEKTLAEFGFYDVGPRVSNSGHTLAVLMKM